MTSSVTQGYPTQCPVCSRRYDHGQAAEIIVEGRGGSIVHLTCSECSASLLVALRFEATGIVGVRMMTDLSREEAKHFLSDKRGISGDELLEVYTRLKERSLRAKDLLS